MRGQATLLGLLGAVFLGFAAAAYAFYTLLLPTQALWEYAAICFVVGIGGVGGYLAFSWSNLRASFGERSTRYGTNAVFYSILFLALLAGLNYLSARRHHRWDVTEAGVHSLSDQSKKVLANLEKDLDIYAFLEGGHDPAIERLLDSYRYVSSLIKPHLVDPDRSPELAEQFNVSSFGTLHLVYGMQSATVSGATEEELTNGIIKVTRTTERKVCFSQGHGEPDLDDIQDPAGYSGLKQALERENYKTGPVRLATLESVPEDCTVLVVAGPERPLTDHEVQAIDTYLENGGRAFIMMEPRRSPELKPLLADWGVKVGDDVVLDRVLRLFRGPALGLQPIANTYGVHPITENFRRDTVYLQVRSIEADASGKQGLAATELVKTGPSSWAERDLEGIFQHRQASLDPETDRKGPVPVAVAVTADLKAMGGKGEGEARLVAFGDSDFANNRHLTAYGYNRDLVLNTVNWLAGEEELISIRPRTLRASRANLTPEDATVVFLLSVLVLPQFLLLLGLGVWWRRSSR